MGGKTLSLIAGTTACNAKCAFCISKTTPFQDMTPKFELINVPRLQRACELAKEAGISVVMITGKGEPTMYADHDGAHIPQYLEVLRRFGFDRIELQTNALLFGQRPEKYDAFLKLWRNLGLSLIAISIVHYDPKRNAVQYTPDHDYVDLPAVLRKLHDFGYKTRLSCTLVKGYIDSIEEMQKMIHFAIENGVDQLTLRKLAAVDVSEDKDISMWTREHMLSEEVISAIQHHLGSEGRLVERFFYGASLYEYGPTRQNVCLTNGLTEENRTGEIRQLIFFPGQEGRIITDWRYDQTVDDNPLVQLNGGKKK